MNNSYYKSPKSNWFKRLFWKAAGVDPQILEKCTFTEQVKYFSLGWLLVITGIFAAISAAIAFHTVFAPNLSNGKVLFHYQLISIFFGVIWGSFIFNLNRFLFISTGNSDGSEAVSLRDIFNSIPKILIAVGLSIAVSVPFSLKLLDDQIGSYPGTSSETKELFIGKNSSSNTDHRIEKHAEDYVSFQKKIIRFGVRVSRVYKEYPYFFVMIILFFLLISIAPIFFKLMMTKGPYEHMEENIAQLSNAEMGIEIIYEYYADSSGKRQNKVINHPVEFMLSEKKRLMTAQTKINDKIIRDWLKQKEKSNVK
jgi:hypothetical protein